MRKFARLSLFACGVSCVLLPFAAFCETAAPLVRFGAVTDLHCADLNPVDNTGVVPVAGKVYYRESLRKLAKAVAVMNAREVDFMIELGDFKDLTQNKAATLPILDQAEAAFARFNGPRYHVLGNHDMDCLTKAEFFAHVKNYDAASGQHVNPTNGYYSFERNGVTFVVLDACYTRDGADYTGNPSMNWQWYEAKVPDAELAWLDATLKAAPGPVVVFCHQRLDPKAWGSDVPTHFQGVLNAADVRAVLEKSKKVKAVFTGHEHKGGVCNLNGIVYYSLVSMAINGPAELTNSFAEIAVHPSGCVSVKEFRSPCSVVPGGGATATPLMVAHRGAGDLEMPEASLAAYSNAVATACDIVKLDLQCTKDGVIVMGHDPSLRRNMGWDVDISDRTYDDIYENGRFLEGGVPGDKRIVRLDEALEIVRSAPMFWVDFKYFDGGFCERALEAIRAAGIDESRLMVATFNQEALVYMKENHPRIRRVGHVDMTLNAQNGHWTSSHDGISYGSRQEAVSSVLAFADRLSLFGVNMPIANGATTSADVAYLQRSGLWVSIWYVQDAATARAHRDDGANAVVTDHVTLVRRGLSE